MMISVVRLFLSFILFLTLALPTVLTAPGTARAADVRLDRESYECMSCHEVTVVEGPIPLVCHEGGCDHAVGIDYAAAAERDRTLRKPASLDPAIRLVNNRIVCVTCHVPYDKANHLELSEKRKDIPRIPDPMLSVDNTGSRLCTSCHLK